MGSDSAISHFRVTLTCGGLTEREGERAPHDVAAEFQQRPWHSNVAVRWDDTLPWLAAENDFDRNGLALFDEFFEVVVACVKAPGAREFKIVSIDGVE